MTIVSVPSEPAEFAFRTAAQPRVRVAAGARVRFQTSDAPYAEMNAREIDAGGVNFQRVNAISGPVWVEGAERGDALGFRVDQITVASRAFVVYVARWRRAMFGLPESRVIEVSIDRGCVDLGDGRAIAVRPMIGCIGLAPAVGAVSSLAPTGPTGGNMDLVEIGPGTTVWLPVQVEGGLLSLGDVHARMGRGEPVGAGLECAGSVTGTVTVAKGQTIGGPILHDGARISFVGTSAVDPAEAEAVAVRMAWEWLRGNCGVPVDLALVLSAGLLEVNAGGPAGNNVVASFPLDELVTAGVESSVWPLERGVNGPD